MDKLFVFLVKLHKKAFMIAFSLCFLAILQVNFKIGFRHSYFWLDYIRNHLQLVRTFIFQFQE